MDHLPFRRGVKLNVFNFVLFQVDIPFVTVLVHLLIRRSRCYIECVYLCFVQLGVGICRFGHFSKWMSTANTAVQRLKLRWRPYSQVWLQILQRQVLALSTINWARTSQFEVSNALCNVLTKTFLCNNIQAYINALIRFLCRYNDKDQSDIIY